MTVLTGPVCDAGRCSQVIAALAAAKARMQDAEADRLAAAFESLRDDAELALTDGQRTAFPAAVVRAVRRLIGEVA